MSLSDFEIINKLGEGAFSTVFKVLRKSDNQVYALKKVRLSNLSQKEKENSLNEVRILASFNHPNIITYKEAFIHESTNTLCIVMELADHGDLMKKIKTHKESGTYFPESEIWKALYEITQGLKCLHDKSILHRDLKGANIFVSKQGRMKLGDLNVSKVNKQGLAYTQTGTPYYASPEVWQDKPYNLSSDIWSLGCVIYEMAALEPPFNASDIKGLYTKVIKGIFPNIPNRYSIDLSNLIKCLLQVNPNLRPSCDKILELSMVKRNVDGLNVLFTEHNTADLLGTIKFEPGLKNMKKKLPASNYDSEEFRLQKIDSFNEVKKKTPKVALRDSPINYYRMKNNEGISPPSKLYLDISNHNEKEMPVHNKYIKNERMQSESPVLYNVQDDKNPFRNQRSVSPKVLEKVISMGNYPMKNEIPKVPVYRDKTPNYRNNEIYSNYPEIRPGLQINVAGEVAYKPSLQRIDSSKARPNSNFGKIGAAVLQSPLSGHKPLPLYPVSK